MTRGKRLLFLRLGTIFTVTGIIMLAVLGRHGRLPLWAAIALGTGPRGNRPTNDCRRLRKM